MRRYSPAGVGERPAELDRLETLVSPLGVVAGLDELTSPVGLERVAGYTCSIGSGIPGHGGRRRGDGVASAGGQALDSHDRARLVAIAEGAERYAGHSLRSDECVLGTAAELDGPALDLTRIPRCSSRELAGNCPLSVPDPAAAIRWIRALEITTGEVTWVPAAMACYGDGVMLPGERFWYRISTGYAVHSDPAEALVRGICEVIERDMIAVTWLQQLALPLVDTPLPEAVRYLIDGSERHFVDTYLFDGSSDIGVPTVYCLQVAAHDSRARQAVGCGTGRTTGAAAQKAVLEAIVARRACHSDDEIPEPRDFKELTDGVRYMAIAERSGSFDFLLHGACDRAARQSNVLPASPVECVGWLADSLRRSGMQVFAVDRTTEELAAVGLTAICAVIPDLQPMTLLPGAQYRAHPRLYSAPRLMGYPTRSEQELNPWPMPLG